MSCDSEMSQKQQENVSTFDVTHTGDKITAVSVAHT